MKVNAQTEGLIPIYKIATPKDITHCCFLCACPVIIISTILKNVLSSEWICLFSLTIWLITRTRPGPKLSNFAYVKKVCGKIDVSFVLTSRAPSLVSFPSIHIFLYGTLWRVHGYSSSLEPKRSVLISLHQVWGINHLPNKVPSLRGRFTLFVCYPSVSSMIEETIAGVYF